jgi:translation elongation factor EF-Tu-like GTPase
MDELNDLCEGVLAVPNPEERTKETQRKTAEAFRKAPFFKGYKPDFYFRTKD